MRHLTLTENAPPRPIALSPEEAAALAESEVAVVTRSPGSGLWEVAAGRKVGVARAGDLQVIVRPKIPIDRLVFLLGYAQNPVFWRKPPVVLDDERDLPEALADSFSRRAQSAIEQGLLQGYTEVSEALPVLRGRVRVGDQLARRPGTLIPLEVSYDEFSVDIAENRILRTATQRLLQMPSIPHRVRHRLHRLRLQLADVSPLVRGEPTPRWQPSRLNARYQPALRLAELVLAGDSFDQRVGSLHVSGFVFDLWRIFEDFVCVAMREALRPFGGYTRLQHRMHLDEDRRVDMRPDLYWEHPSGHRLVVDAKYKAENKGFPNADLYQVMAYCAVLGLQEGHLIYAAGNEAETSHRVVGTGVHIHCHALKLHRPPEELLAQVLEIAGRVAANHTERRRRVAAETGEPLLYIGDDFARTDILSARE